MDMENFLVFAVIGLLTGAAARLLYPDRRAVPILNTMVVGMLGALIGGMISWRWWSDVAGEFHTGNLILSFLGATTVIVLWAGIAYTRSLLGYRDTSQYRSG